MIKTRRQLIIPTVCLLTLLAGAVVSAQDSPTPRPRRFSASSASGTQDPTAPGGRRHPGPPDAMGNFVGREMHFGGKTITGAPYSATVITETTQTLSDGTHITRST